MTISTGDYSFLSTHVYGDMPEKPFHVNALVEHDKADAKYVVLEIIENKLTGYQGAIYQNANTRELVAVHRGTEMTHGVPEFVKDTLIADGAMVLKTINTQIPDAVRLMVFA